MGLQKIVARLASIGMETDHCVVTTDSTFLSYRELLYALEISLGCRTDCNVGSKSLACTFKST